MKIILMMTRPSYTTGMETYTIMTISQIMTVL